jgi:hypothetical protein
VEPIALADVIKAKGGDMTIRAEKTEARQGERRNWQEHVLYASLGGAVIALAVIAFVFII